MPLIVIPNTTASSSRVRDGASLMRIIIFSLATADELFPELFTERFKTLINIPSVLNYGSGRPASFI
ncbi:hypothetical protein [Algoriphagus aquimarinus]|uniref:Uncharacterized protein n=1 Tax=Algoriphagus aquimarinus TaxID=237018 RepID=A0A5C7ACU2_9BACT|nr:hypothetical protein [Algoriphagus aquimarinus]TXE06418.1 hypothetical protein ESV85_16695 [Algoriphagus aquimarinus]